MPGPGRPTLYKPENAERARQLCMLGATNRMLADDLGVARSTIDQWIATIPGFAHAVRQGREHADVAVVESLFMRARGYQRRTKRVVSIDADTTTTTYEADVPPDVRACIFWLRNRRPEQWRETAALADDDEDDEAWQARLEAAEERVRRMRLPAQQAG